VLIQYFCIEQGKFDLWSEHHKLTGNSEIAGSSSSRRKQQKASISAEVLQYLPPSETIRRKSLRSLGKHEVDFSEFVKDCTQVSQRSRNISAVGKTIFKGRTSANPTEK
jgi:hypothetical protein